MTPRWLGTCAEFHAAQYNIRIIEIESKHG
jgi:hypothetical protein